ncbi:MAG: hypothetical protein IJ433_05415 [Ruminococcus sp.]|nr:hypothetical protein [Ruminococcus sp.]
MKTICNKLVQKLYFVYFLNVVDWVCTVLLLDTGMFYEANPIARTFISSIWLGFLLKCVVPFVVVFGVSRYMHILGINELRFVDMLICFALTVYLAITIDHIVNFTILLQY